jgi:hypothetical protein
MLQVRHMYWEMNAENVQYIISSVCVCVCVCVYVCVCVVMCYLSIRHVRKQAISCRKLLNFFPETSTHDIESLNSPTSVVGSQQNRTNHNKFNSMF